MLLTGMARSRIGGFLGIVPLRGVSGAFGKGRDGHDELDHDGDPGEGEIPVEEVELRLLESSRGCQGEPT
jgi:hypothetical protein